MNKKTFAVAVIFLILTLLWLGANLYWKFAHLKCVGGFDLFLGLLFVVAGSAMVCHEFRKKRRRHISEVYKHRIP